MSYYKELPKHGIELSDESAVFYLENIKCGGCAKSITDALVSKGFEDVRVDHEKSQVALKNPQSDDKILLALNALRTLGYPVIDTEEGLAKLALNLKSYASCAIGKIN